MRIEERNSDGVRALIPHHRVRYYCVPYLRGLKTDGQTPWTYYQTGARWPTTPKGQYVIPALSNFFQKSRGKVRKQLVEYMRYNRNHYFALTFITLFLSGFSSFAQRISDVNHVGWYSSFNTLHVSPKISVWLEYQWRRDNVVTDWQQSLARTGVQYHFKNGMSTLLGYGYIITFPYGDYPAGQYTIPEHRIFEQRVWNDGIGRVGLNHRMRLEQRFAGKVNQTAAAYEVTDWTYLNRFRYQLRATVPINHKKMQDNTWYAAAYDELFIGFGKNVNQNVFDQNRIGLLLGYQLNGAIRAEGGYFNQTVQQGGLVGGKEVYQYNHGVMISLYYTQK